MIDPESSHCQPSAIESLLESDQLEPDQRRNLVQACKTAGMIDPAIGWLERQVKRHPNDGQLGWLLLEMAEHGRDLPRLAVLAASLLRKQRSSTTPSQEGVDHLRRLRFRALSGQALPEADAALADLPGGASPLMAAELAQKRYRFATSRALARMIDARPDPGDQGPTLTTERRAGLELEERLALMEADIPAARAARVRIWALQRASDDPEQRRLVGAEPLRQWRLELGANLPALKLLGGLDELAPEERLAAIAAGLELEPTATPLAFALLLQLRRAGRLGPQAPIVAAREGGTVPWQFWLQRRFPLSSPALDGLAERWLELHPGSSLEWVDPERESIEGWADLPPLVREACLCVNDPHTRGELLRLGLLWLHGGVAVEANARCQCSLADLLPPEVDLLLVQDAMGSLGLPLIAARPRQPFVGQALQMACRTVLQGQGYSCWDVSGACPLSLAFAAFAREAAAAGSLPAGVRIVSVHELRHWIGLDLPLPRPEGAPEEPPVTSLFNQLRRQDALRRLQSQAQ